MEFSVLCPFFLSESFVLREIYRDASETLWRRSERITECFGMTVTGDKFCGSGSVILLFCIPAALIHVIGIQVICFRIIGFLIIDPARDL